jgi:hypothetical protein
MTSAAISPDRKEWFVVKRILAAFAVLGLVLITPALAGATATSHAQTSTSRFFGKSLGSEFTTPAGAVLSENAEPAVGDRYEGAGELYHGSHSHYGTSLAGSYLLTCTFTTVSNTALIGSCVGVVTIGNSLLYANVTENFASQSAVSAYPIAGGTGTYKGASGRVLTYTVGKTSNSDFVIQVTKA